MTTNELNKIAYELIYLHDRLDEFVSKRCIGFHSGEELEDAKGCEACYFYDVYDECCNNSITSMGINKFRPGEQEIYDKMVEGLARHRKQIEEKLTKEGLSPQLVKAITRVDF